MTVDDHISPWIVDDSFKPVDLTPRVINNTVEWFLAMLQVNNLGKSLLKTADNSMVHSPESTYGFESDLAAILSAFFGTGKSGVSKSFANIGWNDVTVIGFELDPY